jgi:Yip1 domain
LNPAENEKETRTTTPDFLPLRLWDLLFHPTRLMDHVGRRPQWWQAGILILLINGVATTWVGPIMVEEYRRNPGSSHISSLVSREQVEASLEKAVDSGNRNKLGSIVSTGLNSWAVTIIFALVLGFFAKMAGGQGSFAQALGVVHWAALIPNGLGVLIKLPIMLNTGEFAGITLSPAAFLPADATGTFLFVFLSYFGEVTIWWGLVLLIIGFERVFGLERGPAILSVVLPWALATGIMAGFRLVFGF